MKSPFTLPKPPSARQTAVISTAICAGLTLFLALDFGTGQSGTVFATNAMAQAASPAAAAPAADAKTETDPKKGTETQTPAAAAEPSNAVFQADPLQSLADSLRRKETELQAREAALMQKEQYIETIRLETQETLKKIELVRSQMEGMAANVDQQRQKQLKKWIEIFQKMSPEKTAPVMLGLDQDLQLELIGQMESGKAAKVLNAFPPDKAAELSAKLKH